VGLAASMRTRAGGVRPVTYMDGSAALRDG